MPSPTNQCGEYPDFGFGPLRMYTPRNSGGMVPSTARSTTVRSSVTGA
jgi:hypothetical protein